MEACRSNSFNPLVVFRLSSFPGVLNRLMLEPFETRLVMLVGLPGSGKSSLAAALLQQAPRRRLIATDTIRSHLFGDAAIQGRWLQVWREVCKQFQQAVQQISDGQTSEAIYDATNAVRRDRRRAIALARACGFTNITGLWLNTPLEICLQRNRQRDRRVPEAVILRMHRCLLDAPPTVHDGCDRLIELR
jgi:predicted kinase